MNAYEVVEKILALRSERVSDGSIWYMCGDDDLTFDIVKMILIRKYNAKHIHTKYTGYFEIEREGI